MKKQSGRSLVAILVSVALLIGLIIVFATGGLDCMMGKKMEKRADGNGQTMVGRALFAGKDEKCRSNIGQVRQSIQINTDPVDETHPATLQDLKLPADFSSCPVGKEPYVYDAATGEVHCVHPGHEKY